MISDWPPTLHLAIGLATIISLYLIKISKKTGQYPPGPNGLPLVGNLYDLPKPGELEAHHWAKHKDLYGLSPLMSIFFEL